MLRLSTSGCPRVRDHFFLQDEEDDSEDGLDVLTTSLQEAWIELKALPAFKFLVRLLAKQR